ncbi:alpha/beta fold hydrolase [Actinomadura parmotrematis]|uniref:Alpha/beta hydrolase n=1 Tax=Actinomadura parmotrematis TaxID=2864039 RepID=A0ABS7FWV4_9ACTN|nr:alpha/beta hydrolase [Actinomadura parmotrematis]MBW8484903.1 alpha/beta hydrolase [Actinomadura parmotrematis]
MATTTVTSADGTTIAVETAGDGTPVVLIGGAFNDRSTVAGLAAALAPHVAAVTYDRRGRGGSDDKDPAGFRVEREVEDLAAVLAHVGGSAGVFGHSSGALLALEGVLSGLPISRLAMYEPPVIVPGTRPAPPAGALERLRALTEAGDRDAAAALFLTEQVGVPAEVVEGMKSGPAWGFMSGQAHTLGYDVAVSARNADPRDARLAAIGVPVLVQNGGAGEAWMAEGAAALAASVPGARHEVLPGEDHAVLQRPENLAPSLAAFFA